MPDLDEEIDPPGEYLERCARIAQGIREAAGFEHLIVVLVRQREALAVHVPEDGSAWYGVARDSADRAELMRLVEGVTGSQEREMSAAAKDFEPAAQRTSVGVLLSGVLWSLAEPIQCIAAAILARDAGDNPAWLAARYEPDLVHYMETEPDVFLRELVRLHEFTQESVDGGLIPKASLRAADVGAAYELEVSPQAHQALAAQAEAFKEKFGREPGPEDPLFFDPEADTPQPLSAQQVADMEAEMAEFGLDQEWFLRNQADLEEAGLLRRGGRKVSRNDPCWCGSGKKYKRCHGA